MTYPALVDDHGATWTPWEDALHVLWRYLVVSGSPTSADVLFCFGSRDLGVPRRAAELYRHGCADTVVVTGGAALGGMTEGETFADVLVAHGVPRQRIIVEHRAQHTGE